MGNDDDERLKRGEAARRRVLGDEWVDRSARPAATPSTRNGSMHIMRSRGAMCGHARTSTIAPAAFW